MQSLDENNTENSVAWKPFLTILFESLLAFYLATFCLAMYFLYRPAHWLTLGIVMVLLYLFVIVFCAKRVFKKLPVAAIMLAIPIAPLLALFIIVSLIPVLQWLKT
ncbi:MAG TPA: hypothetical protein VHZ76_01940 [Gammaproteobacteria bacterium]|nr:hypothetical protein [Gammaproteobacteria bacterium]